VSSFTIELLVLHNCLSKNGRVRFTDIDGQDFKPCHSVFHPGKVII